MRVFAAISSSLNEIRYVIFLVLSFLGQRFSALLSRNHVVVSLLGLEWTVVFFLILEDELYSGDVTHSRICK